MRILWFIFRGTLGSLEVLPGKLLTVSAPRLIDVGSIYLPGLQLNSHHPRELPSFRLSDEMFWVDYQPFLLSRGYKLRPRYQPDWVPSWGAQKITGQEEDSLFLIVSAICDPPS